MTISLVGNTGFVGSNLVEAGIFNELYNSKNIQNAYNTQPDLLVYSGVRAEKYLANQNPEEDYASIKNAIENIRRIKPKKLVLISTIDIYKNPVNVNEKSVIDIDGLQPYGLNRYKLEEWAEEEFDNELLIVRLPGLYGKNIKKNFIYDMIHMIPTMLNESKFIELFDKNNDIKRFYTIQANGFYKCKEMSILERLELKDYFKKVGFSALNFTDSRGSFQFYNLQNLWQHIDIALKEKIHKLNMATEPVVISEIYQEIKKSNFDNEIATSIPCYDFKTIYADIYNGKNGYISDKSFVLRDIRNFVEEYQQ
jgi:hypothetical protein